MEDKAGTTASTEVVVTGLGALSVLGPGDLAGSDTFRRYRYQAKVTLAAWLQCLLTDGPVAVACERIEDHVMVYSDRLRFRQVKTRDRGVWTTELVCKDGGGLDSLVRAYLAVRDAGHLNIAIFELLLEGPAADKGISAAFFADPRNASSLTRTKLHGHGLPYNAVSDFLSRLRMRPGMCSRETIDAVNINALASVFPTQPFGAVKTIYTDLLRAVEHAQAAEVDLSGPVWSEVLADLDRSGPRDLSVLSAHILTNDQLLSMTPFIPDAELAARQADVRRIGEFGERVSRLEWKLAAAGATATTIAEAKTLRAIADVQRQLALGARENSAEPLASLAVNVLRFGRAAATSIGLGAATNPTMAIRHGDAVFAHLAQQVTQLAALGAP